MDNPEQAGGGSGHERAAVIGIGSNSVRLLVAEVRGKQTAALERLQVVTRLASYEGGSPRAGALLLSGKAIEQTASAAAGFARRASALGARMLGVAATEAVRAAANRTDLTERLERELQVQVTVVSGEEEARLGWRAIAEAYGQGEPLAVIDIGGGSTDLSLGMAGAPTPDCVRSIKVGSRTLMHRHDLHLPTGRQALRRVMTDVARELEPEVAPLRPVPRMGVLIGGTASVLAEALAAVRAPSGEMGGEVERRRLEDWVERIAAMDTAGRAGEGVPADRADVIVAGGVILRCLLDLWGLDAFYPDERTILDAFLLECIRA